MRRRSGSAPAPAQLSVVRTATSATSHYAGRWDARIGRCHMRTVEELSRMVVVMVQVVVIHSTAAGCRRGRITKSTCTPLATGRRHNQRRTARRCLGLFQHFGVKRSIQRSVSVRQAVVVSICADFSKKTSYKLTRKTLACSFPIRVTETSTNCHHNTQGKDCCYTWSGGWERERKREPHRRAAGGALLQAEDERVFFSAPRRRKRFFFSILFLLFL